jgi:hypothetical protein
MWVTEVAAITWRALPPDQRFISDNLTPSDQTITWDSPGMKPVTDPHLLAKLNAASHRNDLPDAPWIIAQREQIRTAAALALMPPGFVLLIGAVFGWAFRGFRK